MKVSKKEIGFSFSFSLDAFEKLILQARYIKNKLPKYFKIVCIIGNNLKTLTNPIVKANTTAVNPKVTPKMCGIVFFIPKLKPE